MATYTKHITQISNDKDWQLDFDITITTPEEAVYLSQNHSVIDSVQNTTITYIEEKTDSNPYGGTAKLRGKCTNTTRVNNILRASVMRDVSLSGNGANLSTGETVNANSTINRCLPVGVDGTYDMIIEHDSDGNGNITFKYSAVFSGDTTYATHTSIVFVAEIPLPHINVQSIPFTEMGPEVRQAITEGSVAIKTRMIYKENQSSLMTTDFDDDFVDEGQIIEEEEKIIILTESDAIKTWELNDERYVPDNGFIGQFVSRTLSGELHNINDDFSIEDKDIELQIGVVQLGTQYQWLGTEEGDILLDENGNRVYVKDLGSDITTWYSLGNFLVTKPEDDEVKDNTKFEAFDYATKFNIDFNPDYTNATYRTSFNNSLPAGVTAKWLAEYTCAQAGIEFTTNDFTNSDFLITSNQFTQGESCRDVMKAISQLAYGWCRIGWDNKCYIDEPATAMTFGRNDNTLTNDNYYSLTTQKKAFGPVNRVVVGMSAVDGEDIAIEDAESIAEYGLTEITVMDNPLIYTEDLRASIIESGRKLFGLYYVPLETETPGHPWLVGNEKLNVYDMEGRNRTTYAFNRTLSYTGHIKSTLVSPAPTEQETTTAYNKTIYKTLRNVGIKVDKQEGLINIINAKTQATADGLSAIETRFETEITDTYSKAQIQEIISGMAEDGTVVSSVTTTAGTFDKNGLTIEQSTASTKTNINANGMIITNNNSGFGDKTLLDVNSEGVDAENVKVRKYLNIGKHSRMEDFIDINYEEGTGIFWIGDDYYG